MFCSNCGKETTENTKFCIHCGQGIVNAIKEPIKENNKSYGKKILYKAGLFPRTLAFVIDWIILTFVNFPTVIYFYFILGTHSSGARTTELFIYHMSFWLYFALMESSSYRATIGKQVMKIQVVDTNGERISFYRASGRHFARYLSVLIFFIGYLMVTFTKEKQSLHDMISETFVVREFE